jgi:zinc transporter, ZIP family
MSAADAAWILGSGAGTALGGLGLLALRRPSERTVAALLGLTGGVMTAAALAGLLVPAFERGHPAEVVAGLAAGAVAMRVADALVPHVHWGFVEPGHGAREARTGSTGRAVMLLTALTIHNVPEGLAVGAAFAAGGSTLGVPVAVAIGLQNVPEGFVAGLPLLEGGVPRRRAAALSAGTGVVEPVAAGIALLALGPVEALLPAALAFAAGAMLYVVVDELVPEVAARGHRPAAALGSVAGFVALVLADLTLS